MKKNVRILLVGAEQVGKTSLILSLVSEEFPEDVPSRAEEITIPADVTPEKVPTHIVDYSAAEQSSETLEEEVRKADVICIVYDVSKSDTLEVMEGYWIPFIQNIGEEEEEHKPIILVGNKSDLSDHSTMDIVVPIMDKYTQVKTCIETLPKFASMPTKQWFQVECSAKLLKNISEMFFYAQKAVLYPEDPLYCQETKQLTPLCTTALTRIFKSAVMADDGFSFVSDKEVAEARDNRLPLSQKAHIICDYGADGVLDDKELNDFQYHCFNSPLEDEEVFEVKSCVRRNTPDGLKDNGLTLTGFLFLHKLFMQRGRHETTWTVLRKFGYGDDLDLREDYCDAGLDIGATSTTELSELGRDFFTKLFEKCDVDLDNALSPAELKDLFSLCPFMPWDEEVLSCVQTGGKDFVTFDSYMALWVLTTYLDSTRVFTWLSYFGYVHGELESQLSTAVTVTRSKDVDLVKKQTSRTVFRCNVIGPRGSGKTAFLQGHVNRSLEALETYKKFTKFTINTAEVNRQEKYLLLSEISWNQIDDELLNSKKCDVICFIYDGSDPTSFSKVVELHENVRSNVPCLFVATKTDLPAVKQNCEVQPSMYCTLNNLPQPVSFSGLTQSGLKKDVYDLLARMAVYPHLCNPDSRFFSFSSSLSLGFGALVVAGVAFMLYRYVKPRKSS